MDYAHIKSIQTVPEQSVPVSYIRRHVKGQNRIEADMQQKARLWSEKSGQSVAQCLEVLSKSLLKANNRLPFIWVTSLHAKNEKTGSRYFSTLFIEKVIAIQMQAGMFNCYGLSQLSNDQTLVATVPHF